jgi:hypothetical protein
MNNINTVGNNTLDVPHQSDTFDECLRAEIRDALENGTQYPWELFARLRADKFLSDIIGFGHSVARGLFRRW